MNQQDLKKLEKFYQDNIEARCGLNSSTYEQFCKIENAKYNIDSFKIQEGLSLKDYLDKHGKELENHKLLAFRKDELWMMDKKQTYYKIPNRSNLLYFAASKKSGTKIALPLILVTILAGVGAAGYFYKDTIMSWINNLINKPTIGETTIHCEHSFGCSKGVLRLNDTKATEMTISESEMERYDLNLYIFPSDAIAAEADKVITFNDSNTLDIQMVFRPGCALRYITLNGDVSAEYKYSKDNNGLNILHYDYWNDFLPDDRKSYITEDYSEEASVVSKYSTVFNTQPYLKSLHILIPDLCFADFVWNDGNNQHPLTLSKGDSITLNFYY